MLTQTFQSSRGTAIVLGGRSWIGYRLTEALTTNGYFCICTSSKPVESLRQTNAGVTYTEVQSASDIARLIHQHKPSVVINLLIGIEEPDFESHLHATQAAHEVGAYYVFSSSALALDGYQDEPLVESLMPLSISPYGIFKGKCETHLRSMRELESLILRFSSIHGFSPWKNTRTVLFLDRVSKGQSVSVQQGIIQNRVSDRHLSECIASLICRRATGVAHTGAADSSEEITFLKKLAERFGYDSKLVVPGDVRNVNLAVIPELGLHPNGTTTEADTLDYLLTQEELKTFQRQYDEGKQ